jgi:hypothetical protein
MKPADALIKLASSKHSSPGKGAGAAFVRPVLLALLGTLAIALFGPASALAAPTWLAPVNLSAPKHGAFNPQVAIDAAGDAVAVWERFDGTNFIIQSASRPAGGSFSAPR